MYKNKINIGEIELEDKAMASQFSIKPFIATKVDHTKLLIFFKTPNQNMTGGSNEDSLIVHLLHV